MSKHIFLIAFVLSCLGGSASSGLAQDTLLREMYGRGVHAYFSRDYRQAHAMFTAVIEQGSKDPRCFYFRGLTYSRTGRADEAALDFRKGAEMEVESPQPAMIDKSLERVQGQARLALEQARQTTRLTVKLAKVKRERERYEQVVRDERAVLRKAGGPATEPEGLPKVAATADSPFAEGDDLVGKPVPAARPASVAEADPFGGNTPTAGAVAEGAAPAAAAADENDPFGAAQPAAAKPAAQPAAAADDADPFGAADPAMPVKPAAGAGEADPFGAADPAMPAKPAAGDADPFGAAEAPAKPAAKQAADPLDAGDPAMPAKPAAGVGDADPFGADDAPAKPAAKPAAEAADDGFGDAMPAAPAKPAAAPAKPAEAPDAAKKDDAKNDPFADEK